MQDALTQPDLQNNDYLQQLTRLVVGTFDKYVPRSRNKY